MKYKIILMSIFLSIQSYCQPFDYCVETFIDGSQRCGKFAKGLGMNCESVKKYTVNGRKVIDVRIVSKSECEYINRIKNNITNTHSKSKCIRKINGKFIDVDCSTGRPLF